MTYRTLKTKKTIQFLDKREVQFFKEAEKTDSTIRVFEMDEEDFLYLNWRKKPPLSEEEVTRILKEFIEKENITDIKGMGKIMGLATKTLAGKAENKLISEIIKKLLQ
jgi:uncharacterized protein YqeY